MFEDVIVEQNPHWVGKSLDLGVERSYFAKLIAYLETGMIISILGVRRAGKSMLLKQAIHHLMTRRQVPAKNILFLNLEHPYFSSYAQDVEYLQKIYEDYLKLAQPEGQIYVLLDEVQFFPQWPIFVKSMYEHKKIQFIITGSNSLLLSSDLITLLSGRTLPIEVFPLSFKELANARGIQTDTAIALVNSRPRLRDLVDQFLKFGGFPGVVLNLLPNVAYDVLNAYAKTILYQDVAPRLQLRKSVELERLFVYLISNIGKPFSYANLSQLFDLSDKAIKEYIGAFADSYLLFELEMFDFSLKKQIKNQKKIYSIDTGQINAVAFRFTENLGRLLENLVFLELRRIGLEVYYYKTANNLEVDFLVKKNLALALVQVALDVQEPQTLKREVKALEQSAAELNLAAGIIITRDHEELCVTEDGQEIKIMPAYTFFCLSDAEKLEMLGLG